MTKLEVDLASIGQLQMTTLPILIIDELKENVRQQQHHLEVKDVKIL